MYLVVRSYQFSEHMEMAYVLVEEAMNKYTDGEAALCATLGDDETNIVILAVERGDDLSRIPESCWIGGKVYDGAIGNSLLKVIREGLASGEFSESMIGEAFEL